MLAPPHLVLLIPGHVVVAVAMVSMQDLGSAQHCWPACCSALPACVLQVLTSTPADHPAAQAQALLRLQHSCVLGTAMGCMNTVWGSTRAMGLLSAGW